MRAFTDNIVIGYPIRGRGDAESELVTIFRNLSYFQMKLTMDGFFVRGAIAVGELYMSVPRKRISFCQCKSGLGKG